MKSPWVLLAGLLVCGPTLARALDKQGSAHGGDVGAGGEGFGVSGALMVGVSIVNSTYAARPDNTGLALMRYAAHADIDLLGAKLSIPLDVNMFTDKTRDGLGNFRPTELDLIGGITSTHAISSWNDIEIGTRVEHDGPLDRGGFSQTYVDVRARLLYSVGRLVPELRNALAGGDVSGWVTLGWFAVNPTYAARPDNSGKALFRYAAHAEVAVWHQHLALGLDAIMFTDRDAHALRPSELDFTPELIGRYERYELHLAFEHDAPLDRGRYTQSFLYALLAVSL